MEDDGGLQFKSSPGIKEGGEVNYEISSPYSKKKQVIKNSTALGVSAVKYHRCQSCFKINVHFFKQKTDLYSQLGCPTESRTMKFWRNCSIPPEKITESLKMLLNSVNMEFCKTRIPLELFFEGIIATL